MIRALRRYVIKKKFQRIIADFDRRIAEARSKHQPVKHLMEAKSAYVHGLLEKRA